MSLATQADTGPSLAEAARHAGQLRLLLGVVENIPGPLERSTIARYKASSTDINENEVLTFSRNTYQQALNNKVENKRKFTITCKTKVAGSKAKQVDYTEPFKFHSADEACITRPQSKQAKAVKYKLYCVDKSKWVSILNLNSMVDQSKLAS